MTVAVRGLDERSAILLRISSALWEAGALVITSSITTTDGVRAGSVVFARSSTGRRDLTRWQCGG